MSCYNGPACKICRRNRVKLYLKGERCFTAKCAIEKRNFPPGIRTVVLKKSTEYGRRLREKQKLRFFYGLTDKSIKVYFQKALKKKGVAGYNLLVFLESRLDNVIYRCQIGRSRAEARQVVRHGHVYVNSQKVDIPSYSLRVGDEFFVKSAFAESIRKEIEKNEVRKMPSWISYDQEKQIFKIMGLPKREEIDTPVEERLVVELLR